MWRLLKNIFHIKNLLRLLSLWLYYRHTTHINNKSTFKTHKRNKSSINQFWQIACHKWIRTSDIRNTRNNSKMVWKIKNTNYVLRMTVIWALISTQSRSNKQWKIEIRFLGSYKALHITCLHVEGHITLNWLATRI